MYRTFHRFSATALLVLTSLGLAACSVTGPGPVANLTVTAPAASTEAPTRAILGPELSTAKPDQEAGATTDSAPTSDASVVPGTEQSATTATNTTASGPFRPLSTCDVLLNDVAFTIGITVDLTEGPYQDPISGAQGDSCKISASGNGTNFSNRRALDLSLQTLLTRQGWVADQTYAADGPNSSQTGYRKGNSLAILNVDLQPAPGVECPANQPISACELTPEQQLYTIVLQAMEQ